jgi:hypothetical protein
VCAETVAFDEDLQSGVRDIEPKYVVADTDVELSHRFG